MVFQWRIYIEQFFWSNFLHFPAVFGKIKGWRLHPWGWRPHPHLPPRISWICPWLCWGINEQNRIVIGARVDDWTVELVIIASNVLKFSR